MKFLEKDQNVKLSLTIDGIRELWQRATTATASDDVELLLTIPEFRQLPRTSVLNDSIRHHLHYFDEASQVFIVSAQLPPGFTRTSILDALRALGNAGPGWMVIVAIPESPGHYNLVPVAVETTDSIVNHPHFAKVDLMMSHQDAAPLIQAARKRLED